MLEEEKPFAGKSITFVHTLAALQSVFDDLVSEHLPGATASHIVDHGFYDAEFDVGALDAQERRRLIGYLNEGAAADSDASVVTCSFLGTYVDELAAEASTVWVRVDEAMGRAAFEHGDRIGVLSTGDAASASTGQLLSRLASETGRKPAIRARVIPAAFDARLAGDLTTHDRIIAAGIDELQPDVDVILLSQASMARAVETMSTAPKVPVLTSPHLLFAQLRGMLAA